MFYLIDYPCCFSLQKGNMSGVKLKNRENIKWGPFEIETLSLVKNLAVKIDVVFLLISTPYETKHLNCNCCDSSYFTNLKIELFQVAFLIKIWNRLKLWPPVDIWPKKGEETADFLDWNKFFHMQTKTEQSNNLFVWSRFDAILKL